MIHAEWIWLNSKNNADQYGHFIKDFDIASAEDVLLKIACDSDYTVYVNGELAAFGQYADYPYYKVYDSIDITKFVKAGKNRLAICGYYCGEDFMTYYRSDAGLIFEITECGNAAACSDKNTLCRQAADYLSGKQIKISGQLGFSYSYDMSKYDGWNKEIYCDDSFTPATEIKGISKDFHIRPIQKLLLGDRSVSQLIRAGSFQYNGGNTEAEKQQNAHIDYNADVIGTKITVKSGGVYALYDLGREEVGFLNFKIKTKESCKITIGYGEHITDGRVRTFIEGRNFAVEYLAKEGEQEFLNTFLRFGCRYLQIFAETDAIEIDFLTLRPVFYPLTIQEFNLKNPLRGQIYDVSVRTLQLCMHDHYEDCPWREQALYTMDSRNQMLCGYYAFKEVDFAKASLRLIGLDKCTEGLLSICYPSNISLKIPSFSLYYIIQMREYMEHSKDYSIAEEFYGKMQLILKTFIDRIKDNLVPIFSNNKTYWNFYEWVEGLSGNLYLEDTEEYDVILNSLLSLALQNMIVIAKTLHKKNEDIEKYTKTYQAINQSVNEEFFDKDKALYRTGKHHNRELYSVLGNSLAILCGAAKGKEKEIAERFLLNGSELTDVTLSMSCFKYDALLKIDREKYSDYVLKDIDEKYQAMLSCGATSFWETLKGESDFNNAGSLCHGWSAMPIYYYHTLKNL